MSQKKFIEVLDKLCKNTGKYRDGAIASGELPTADTDDLFSNEHFVLFLCGVYCGHLDPITGDPAAATGDSYDRFRGALTDLCTKGAKRRKAKDTPKDFQDEYRLTIPQMHVLDLAGVCAGHQR